MSQIDLVWLSSSAEVPSWPLGEVWQTDLTLDAMCKRLRERLANSNAAAWYFWDSALGKPDVRLVQELLSQSADLWHGGLNLGLRGLPGLCDFVNPTWMLNCDPDGSCEATSWRLSLRACLVRTEVLRQLGGPSSEFETLTAASLEMGHRYITQGAILRYVPSMVQPAPRLLADQPRPTFQDELRFVYYRFGNLWSRAALLRAVLSGYVSIAQAIRGWRMIRRAARPNAPFSLDHAKLSATAPKQPRVSVLIPTLDRYSYLRTLLAQLRQQTVKPTEIIIVDQTERHRRDTQIGTDFADLPLKIIYRDRPGQCSSRNEGLSQAIGDYVLFIDDDDEVAPSLIEDHLHNVARFQCTVSSGVADEVGAPTLAPACPFARASDVFPTNNTLVRREVLQRSGLFDLAYERGQRADGDLGMRVYLSGALMVLDPAISVLHHHAPSGGLRTYKARVVTYASSRNRIRHRQLPSATEIYLATRYFTARQVRETIWLGVLGTFSIRGSAISKTLKLVVGLMYLPNTLWCIRRERRRVQSMLQKFPDIPRLQTHAPCQDHVVRDYGDAEVSVAIGR